MSAVQLHNTVLSERIEPVTAGVIHTVAYFSCHFPSHFPFDKMRPTKMAKVVDIKAIALKILDLNFVTGGKS